MDNPCYSCVDYDGAACDWCKRNEYRAHRGIETLKMSMPVFTNYDRIVSKTPEELADYLWSVKKYDRPYDKHISSWLRWLKAPADKEGEG